MKKSTIPITVRQLEAIVRVSEALAKMQLSADVTIEHVKEAVRLFKSSTLSAARAGHNMEGMVRYVLLVCLGSSAEGMSFQRGDG